MITVARGGTQLQGGAPSKRKPEKRKMRNARKVARDSGKCKKPTTGVKKKKWADAYRMDQTRNEKWI